MRVSPRVEHPLQTPEKATPQFKRDDEDCNFSEQKRQVCLSIPSFQINERSLHFLSLSTEALKDKHLRTFLSQFDLKDDLVP
jgi:hypothetical protein